jgi:hypothetical protein
LTIRLQDDSDPVALVQLRRDGLIGWHSVVTAGSCDRIGIFGFGAPAQMITRVCTWQGRRILAFTRPGDVAAQGCVRSLSAAWAASLNQKTARNSGCSIHRRACRRSRADRVARGEKRLTPRMQRDPHKLYSTGSVPAPLVGATDRAGRQSDPSEGFRHPVHPVQGPAQNTHRSVCWRLPMKPWKTFDRLVCRRRHSDP